MGDERFQDAGETIGDFADTALVRCPSCDGRAVARRDGAGPGAPRLTCGACGLSRDRVARQWREEGIDPWFGLPLWLHTHVRGQVLWALNAEHLAFMRGYVSATLRERQPGRNQSVASRLPRWLKDASMREPVLKGIEELEEKLP